MKAYALAAVVFLTGCTAQQLPRLSSLTVESLGRIGASALPIGPEKEREIGSGIAATVIGRYGLVEDPELNRYVNLVGQTIAQEASRRSEVEYRFGVLATDDVNAFAAPGGYVLVTRGALALMSSEAELAGVLAHEVGHVDQQHVLTEIRRASVLQTTKDESNLRGPLLDQVTNLGTSALFTGLGRGDEMEADSLGALYAAAAGYRPDGLATFLARLETNPAGGSLYARLREIRATHPPAAERIEALRRQLPALGTSAGSDAAQRFRRFVPAGR